MKTTKICYETPEVDIVAINEESVLCQASLQGYDVEDEPGWFNRN